MAYVEFLEDSQSIKPSRVLQNELKKVQVSPQARKIELTSFRRSLPIFKAKSDILGLLERYSTLIVEASTGSGKSTQVPQYIIESGKFKRVCVTQPRRIAAITIAQRVSDEFGAHLGEDVGYSVRFDHKFNPRSTRIKYATDGMLLRELMVDDQLSNYDVVCLDEAHERTVATDVLLALLKKLQKTTRPTLKLVVMSATIDSGMFLRYFDNSYLLRVEGRSFPVSVWYTHKPEPDFLEAAVVTVAQIHVDMPEGDVLVFLTGQEDIENAMELLHERSRRTGLIDQLLVLPFYAALPQKQQDKVFLPPPRGIRKIVLATNIAETSLTISGINYVVDCGLVKKRIFNPRTGVDMLLVVPISKAESWQRSGRAGREQSGSCYRLYTEQSFEKLNSSIVPEILRANLSTTCLQLKSLGIENPMQLPFLNPPSVASMKQALQDLVLLGCLDMKGNLTRVGQLISQLPLDPKYGKIVIESAKNKCVKSVLKIISLLSVDSPVFYLPRKTIDTARKLHNRFVSIQGDHLTLFNVYEAVEMSHFSKKWCKDHFINFRAILKARAIYEQLETVLVRMGVYQEPQDESDPEIILKSLITGFFLNSARLLPNGKFKSFFNNQEIDIHPSSVLFGKTKSPCVFYTELVLTTKKYMRCLSPIPEAWLGEVVPHIFKRQQE